MSRLKTYASIQKEVYDRITGSLTEAQAAVMPDYPAFAKRSLAMTHQVLRDHMFRQGQIYDPEAASLADLQLLDFGCGVGRMIAAFVERGTPMVDGVDISANMLRHAAENLQLKQSRFFLSSGVDAGDAENGAYDIAYSFVCFHHIPMRQTRIRLLEALCDKLKPGGTVYIEFKFFPGISSARIPRNHAAWPENKIATGTNSTNDVWITPDTLGMVYDDFSLYFSNILLHEQPDDQDTRENVSDTEYYTYDPNRIYQYRFNKLYVSGTKAARSAVAGSSLDNPEICPRIEE